jgi:carbon storage regulator
MLVLTRKAGEAIRIGDDICLTVVAIQGNRVRLAVTAPAGAHIRRGEPDDLADPPCGQGSPTDSSQKS